MIDKISENKVSGARGPNPVAVSQTNQDKSPDVDSTASTIEKSKSVRVDVVPPISTPILIAPSEQCEAFAVASLDASGRPITNTIHSFVLKGEEIKDSVLKGWMNNLREIEEYVRQLLISPVYQQMQEILRKGDPKLESISGVQGASSSNPAARDGQVELLSTLDRWQTLERVPSSAEVADTSGSADSARLLIIPLTAALLAGGGLAIGHGVIHSANPMGSVVEMVEQIQPLFPTVSLQDLVPLINLMVVGPLYFSSWNEAVSNLRGRDRQNHLPAIHNFAKDVIKIVIDPHFVQGILVQKMKGTDNLSPVDQDRLARMLKVVLAGVALSLLYSVEVGKVQSGKFGGMEPEELRDLLMGKFNELPDPAKKATEHEQLVASLIARTWELLNPLSAQDRTAAVEMLLSYVAKHRDVDPMLDPSKVFDEAIDATYFDPKDKIGIVKA